MIGWIVLGLIVGVGLIVGTIAWWRVGDEWADREHKKFGPGSDSPPSSARVISRQGDATEAGHDVHSDTPSPAGREERVRRGPAKRLDPDR